MASICALPACERAVYARGHCERHYRQLLRTGRVVDDPTPGECAVDACDRAAVTRGWCHGHYLRWVRTGRLQPETPLVRRPRAACTAAGCDRPAASRGLCTGHLWRLRTRDDLQESVPLRTPGRAGGRSHGYVKLPVAPEERWLVGGDVGLGAPAGDGQVPGQTAATG